MGADNDHDAFVRWQGIAIAQFTYATNLVLGLAVATLGFAVTLLLNKEFVPVSWQKYAFSLGLLALVASIATGICFAVNRLRDFRATATTARGRAKGANADDSRELAESLGKCAWTLFRWQITSFAVALLLIVVGVGGIISSKLF
jgi:hypothetical protein